MAEKPSAYLLAEIMLIKYIEDSVWYPKYCKNLAVDQIKMTIELLKISIGSIELAARRACASDSESIKEV